MAIEGKLNAEQCSFTNIGGYGMFCFGTGNAVVVDCSFCNCGAAGLCVGLGATLLVKNSRMHSNGTDGLEIIDGKCVAINCVISYNCFDGIKIFDSSDIVLIRNSISVDNGNGINTIHSEVDIRENTIFDNGLWGIWCQSNSGGSMSMNTIFRNTVGGVRAGYQAEYFSPSVIEMNKIYDNTGPGFVENVNDFELNEDLTKSFMKSSNSLVPANFQDNEVYNNKESKKVKKLNLFVPYCSNCRKKCQVKMCEKWFTAAYCDKLCQRKHFSKHERICKRLREKSSYLIDDAEDVEGRKEVGPKFSSSPPQNGRRFIIKVRTVIGNPVLLYFKLPDCNLVLNDRSFQLHKSFVSKFIQELVNEYGVICAQTSTEKKPFFYCLFEDNGQLRLFTNDFPEFQSW